MTTLPCDANVPRMRAAIYCRVSTDRQRERHTIGAQLSELPIFVSRMGWNVIDTYVDDGRSGETVEGRPAFRRLLDDVSNGLVDILVVIDLDRITRARRSAEGALIYDHLRDAHVKIATPSQGVIDLDDEDQDLLVGIKRELAKWEKRKIQARITRGWREAARQGRKPKARAPYALDCVRNPEEKGGGHWEVVDAEAALVRRIFRGATAGKGVEEIAVELRAGGHATRTGTPWHPVAVHRVLRNTAYRGLVTYRIGGESIEVRVPAIVDDATWYAAQQGLRDRKTFAGRAPVSECLLAKVVRCGVCGRSMTVRRAVYVPTKKVHVYYACMSTYARRTGVPPCGNRYHHAPDTDAIVWERLRTLLDDDLLAEALADDPAVNSSADAVDATEIKTRLASLVASERNVLGRHRRGLVSDAACDAELTELAAERRALEAQLADLESAQLDAQLQRAKLVEAARRVTEVADALEDATFEERRAFVRLLVPRKAGFGVTLNPSGDVEIHGLMAAPTIADSSMVNETHVYGKAKSDHAQPAVAFRTRVPVLTPPEGGALD